MAFLLMIPIWLCTDLPAFLAASNDPTHVAHPSHAREATHGVPLYLFMNGTVHFGQNIIAFIILGLLAGAVAKALLPGDDPGGFIITAIIGVVGALLGGFLAGVIFDADPMDEFFDISTWVTAIIGSIVLLLIYRLVAGRRGAMA